MLFSKIKRCRLTPFRRSRVKNFLPCSTMVGNNDRYFCSENSKIIFEKLNRTLHVNQQLTISAWDKYYFRYPCFDYNLCKISTILRQLLWVPWTPGNWVVKSKLYPCIRSAALRQLNPINKKDHKIFFSVN